MEQLVNMELNTVEKTGAFSTACMEWAGADPAGRNHSEFKVHFGEAYESRLQSGLGFCARPRHRRGGGHCRWQPPSVAAPPAAAAHKTVLAGFPSEDKELVHLQMEALSGWRARDEWDCAFLGPAREPFIKSNYPHYGGVWGWGAAADQVVLVISNLRRSLLECKRPVALRASFVVVLPLPLTKGTRTFPSVRPQTTIYPGISNVSTSAVFISMLTSCSIV